MGVMFQRLRAFLFVLTGLFIFVSLLSLWIPSQISIVKSVEIHDNADSVFTQIRDLKNWRNWHPVFQQDDIVVAITRPSSGAGATATWSSGKKHAKITLKTIHGNAQEFVLTSNAENDAYHKISVQPHPGNLSVEVEWQIMTKLKWYPWEKFNGIFLEQITGPGYQEALNQLRGYIESKTNTALTQEN